MAARGLDIPSVATVVHYDVARMVDTFIHRAGRTAVGAEVFCFFAICVCVKMGSLISSVTNQTAMTIFWTRVSDVHLGI